MIRAIAFDFDGVLVESVDVKTRAYAYLFKEYGQDVVSKVVDYHMENVFFSRVLFQTYMIFLYRESIMSSSRKDARKGADS